MSNETNEQWWERVSQVLRLRSAIRKLSAPGALDRAAESIDVAALNAAAPEQIDQIVRRTWEAAAQSAEPEDEIGDYTLAASGALAHGRKSEAPLDVLWKFADAHGSLQLVSDPNGTLSVVPDPPESLCGLQIGKAHFPTERIGHSAVVNGAGRADVESYLIAQQRAGIIPLLELIFAEGDE